MIGGWKAKRFWSDVSVSEDADGFTVLLDTRRVLTPGKHPLIVPTRSMAEAVAAEWAAQTGEIKPLTMPVTRAANSAIERVRPQRAEVAAMLAAYAQTDLTCHRADTPVALAQRQAQAWDPVLEWAARTHGAPLIPTVGVLPVDQPPDSLHALADHVAGLDEFRLTALHDLVTLSGSLLLGLATAARYLDPAQAWSLSRIDEDWQIEHWGDDEDAAEAAAIKRDQFLQADAFWTLSGDT